MSVCDKFDFRPNTNTDIFGIHFLDKCKYVYIQTYQKWVYIKFIQNYAK